MWGKSLRDKVVKLSRKKAVKYPAAALLLFHLGTQALYTGSEILTELRPSNQRVDFQRKFGFPIKGYPSDIQSACPYIAEVLHKEQLEKPFEISSLRVTPPNYLKKSIPKQLEFIFCKPTKGTYWDDEITVVADTTRNVIHHEVKHDKTHDVITEHPEFLERWKALAVDENGNSLYLSLVERFCSRVRVLKYLVGADKRDDEKNAALGFVRSYGRRNVFEDIATICEEAEEPEESKFVDWLYGPNPNDRIKAKFELAQEYGLIPAEFFEYIWVKKLFWDTSRSSPELEAKLRSVSDAEKAGELGELIADDLSEKDRIFLDASEQFLEKHPETVYEAELRYKRGNNYANTLIDRLNREKCLRLAIEEYKKALNVKYKDINYSHNALAELVNCYTKLVDMGDKESEPFVALYREALGEYERRLNSGDLQLSTIGITDFLKEKGVKLE